MAQDVSDLDVVSLDDYFVYRCDARVGIPVPWHDGPLPTHDKYQDVWNRDYIHAVDVERIGLVLACSESDTYKRLITDARLRLVIEHKPFWDVPFAAFADEAMAEEMPDAPTSLCLSDDYEDSSPLNRKKKLLILSQSLPVDPVLDIPARIPWRMDVYLDKDLSDELKLQEREVFSAIARKGKYKPSWFIRIGARAIGKKYRARL